MNEIIDSDQMHEDNEVHEAAALNAASGTDETVPLCSFASDFDAFGIFQECKKQRISENRKQCISCYEPLFVETAIVPYGEHRPACLQCYLNSFSASPCEQPVKSFHTQKEIHLFQHSVHFNHTVCKLPHITQEFKTKQHADGKLVHWLVPKSEHSYEVFHFKRDINTQKIVIFYHNDGGLQKMMKNYCNRCNASNRGNSSNASHSAI